uniref:Uncharacterized protein n=1 Tax=Magallana gigas TaxID=29159 RepID=K1P712_MAGGI
MSVRNDFGGTGGGGGDVTVSATTGGFFLGVGLGFHGTAYTGELSGNEEAGPTTEEKDSNRGRFDVRRCFGGVFPNVEKGESGGPHGSMDRRLGLGRVKLTTSSSSSAKLNVRVGWVGHGLCISALPL